MSIKRIFAKVKLGFDFITGRRALKKRLRFLTRIINTRAFLKLSLRDKITSIARLILITQCDYGTTPAELRKALLSLSSDLKRQELEHLCSVYPFSKRPRVM